MILDRAPWWWTAFLVLVFVVCTANFFYWVRDDAKNRAPWAVAFAVCLIVFGVRASANLLA